MIEGLGDLFRGGGAPEDLGQLRLLLRKPAEEQFDVHREANGARLVGEGAGEGLADPPHRVGGEARAAPGLELLHRLEEAEVPLLDEVEQRETTIQVAT